MEQQPKYVICSLQYQNGKWEFKSEPAVTEPAVTEPAVTEPAVTG